MPRWSICVVLAAAAAVARADCSCTTVADCHRVCFQATACVNGECIFKKFAAGTKCPGQSRSNGQECDLDDHDYCDAGGTCRNGYKSRQVQCRASRGRCDVPEYCSGKASTCPCNEFAPRHTACLGDSNAGHCDGDDFCDGRGRCVDVFLPRGTVCSESSQCKLTAKCTGLDGECPRRRSAPEGTKCVGKRNDGPCDGQDECNGRGSCVDRFLNNVLCDKAEVCGESFFCNGKGSECPVPGYTAFLEMCAAKNSEAVTTTTKSPPVVLAAPVPASEGYAVVAAAALVASGVGVVAYWATKTQDATSVDNNPLLIDRFM